MNANHTISEYILSKIKSEFNVIDECRQDGYFLFDFGKDSVTHFKVSHLNWKFGIWCVDDDKEGKDVSLFGEHLYRIDKFKPSQTVVSLSFNLTREQLGSIIKGDKSALDNDIAAEFIQTVGKIKSNPVKQYEELYGVNTRHWFSDMWDFHVEEHIRNFAENDLNRIVCRAIVWFCNLMHGRSFIASLKDEGKNMSPRFEIMFRHYTDNYDLTYKRYCRWFGNKVYIGFGKNIRIGHYYKDSERSFYYNK